MSIISQPTEPVDTGIHWAAAFKDTNDTTKYRARCSCGWLNARATKSVASAAQLAERHMNQRLSIRSRAR